MCGSNNDSLTGSFNSFQSKIEQSILSTHDEPIKLNSLDIVTANGETGFWMNRCEHEAFKGPIPISRYPINRDSCPLIINKKPKDIECHHEVAVKYLEPPKIATPGPIIINQMPNILPPTAPPIIIRQPACKQEVKETQYIRELPPQPPSPPETKVINIPGKLLPPPARKLIIERLPEQPDKPQDVHIERWLPFKDIKRKVILNPKPADPVVCKPRNIIVSWEKMKCSKVNTEFKNAGVEKADPKIYMAKHGRKNLKAVNEMPSIVNEVQKHHNIELAANHKKPYYMELEGDLHALSMIDLDKEGLGEYKSFFSKYLNGMA